jgi:KTSC domain
MRKSLLRERISLHALYEPMEMIRVFSSAIFAVGYDRATERMKIHFAQGHTYDFCRVPESVFTGLLDSRSKGRYYNDHIRGRYQC